MRIPLAPPLKIAALAILTSRAPAQAPAYDVPGPPVVYRYAAPARPAYVHQYPSPAPRQVRPPNPTGYRNRPYYGAYGYGNDSNGSTDGYPPFRGRRAR